MVLHEQLEQIREQYGSEYLLRKLAEECGELIVATHHHICAKRRESRKDPNATILEVIEEMADVSVMVDCVRRALLNEDQQLAVDATFDAKCNRMVNRLLGGKWDG